MREFPRAGNEFTGLHGEIGFANERPYFDSSNTSIIDCISKGKCQSYLCVLAAPRTVAQQVQVRGVWKHFHCVESSEASCVCFPLQLRYVVEGVASNWSVPFTVTNADTPGSPLAAYIDAGEWSRVSGTTNASNVGSTYAALNTPLPEWTYVRPCPCGIVGT